VQRTSGWILAVQIQNENVEQEWIAKYRAALDEIPTKQPPLARVRAALETAWRTAISRIGHAHNKPDNKPDKKQRPDAEVQPYQLATNGSGLKIKKPTARAATIREHTRSPQTKNRRRHAS
jgi:hypothetical protein